MRIIGGKYKGHQLTAFQAPHIRPTTDRVKETLFNKLMFDVEGARVLDLYAGTGNLGLEALSRGARHVTFVESHSKSVSIVKKNISHLKITDGYDIWPIDVFKFLKEYDGEKFDIILVDPPFTQKIAHDSMVAISESPCWVDGCIIFIESSKQERIEDSYPPVVLKQRKAYGDKSLSQFIVEL